MKDARMKIPNPVPFDCTRMLYGRFKVIVDA
jgi:uncharacterized protein YbaA (DUF1428 family)